MEGSIKNNNNERICTKYFQKENPRAQKRDDTKRDFTEVKIEANMKRLYSSYVSEKYMSEMLYVATGKMTQLVSLAPRVGGPKFKPQ